MPALYQVKAELFRTLGHPARIRILELLSERDRPVYELLAAIDIEQSNLSQQLAVLRRAGLVTQRREGAEVVYAASVPAVAELLLTARRLLADLLDGQEELRGELEQTTTPHPAHEPDVAAAGLVPVPDAGAPDGATPVPLPDAEPPDADAPDDVAPAGPPPAPGKTPMVRG